MTTDYQKAIQNAQRWTLEDKARRASKIIEANREGASHRYDNYLVLMKEMRKRAYNGKVTARDLRTIAQANAGDKLRAGRMTLAFLEKQLKDK